MYFFFNFFKVFFNLYLSKPSCKDLSNKSGRTMIMLLVRSHHFPLLGSDEKRPTVLCVTALPRIRAFHFPLTVKSEPVYHCCTFSWGFGVETYWNNIKQIKILPAVLKIRCSRVACSNKLHLIRYNNMIITSNVNNCVIFLRYWEHTTNTSTCIYIVSFS